MPLILLEESDSLVDESLGLILLKVLVMLTCQLMTLTVCSHRATTFHAIYLRVKRYIIPVIVLILLILLPIPQFHNHSNGCLSTDKLPSLILPAE